MSRVSNALLLVAMGCSEYGFSTPHEHAEPDGDRPYLPKDDPGSDTALVVDDTGDGDDTGPTTYEVPPEDPCYEPEEGYALNPAARLVVVDASADVVVTFVGSDSGYQDDLWLDSPRSNYLYQAWTATSGSSASLGTFSGGTELVFSIFVNNTGDRWQSGPASRNDDGVVHGAATYEGACTWMFGFEDLRGGGDEDYNDVIFRVSGPLRQEE